MTRPTNTKPQGGNLGASDITTAWASDSKAKDSAATARAVVDAGLVLAVSGFATLADLSGADADPALVDAADAVTLAVEHLARSADTARGGVA